MASYKVIIENSTLGAFGSIVSGDDITAAPADVELLLSSGIVEEVKTKTTTSKDS